MASLEENINQAIADFDDIEAAIKEQGVDVPSGTDTSLYGTLIRKIEGDTQAAYEAGKQAEYDIFWDGYQDSGNRKNYQYAFYGRGWNKDTLKPKHIMAISSGTQMFLRCNEVNAERLDMSEVCKKLDTSQITEATSMFQDAFLDNVTIDLGNATTISGIFRSAYDGKRGIKNVTLKVTEKCTNYGNAFAYCEPSEEIIFTEDSVIASNGLNVQWSKKLTHDSLMSIINALADKTADTSGTEWIVTIGETNKAKLTADELAVADAKGWQVK